jgi:capsular exopolysaccharide synthesis family protein
MNNTDPLGDELVVEQGTDSSADTKALIARFVIYWPLLLILLALAVAGSWTYIRYTPKLYGASAVLSIKRENPLGNNSTSISINLGTSQNTLDKELMLLSSRQTFEQVVKRNHLYSEIIEKGSVISSVHYGKTAPFKLKLEKPDSIANPGVYSIEIDWKTGSVVLGDKVYPFNTVVNTPFGRGVFEKNLSQEGRSYDILLFSVYTVPQKANMLRSGLTVTLRPRQPDLLDMKYTDIVPERAIDILDSIVPIYDDFSLADRRKSLMNSFNFINDRLKVVEGELSTVEQNISNFKSANEISTDISEQGALNMAGMEESRGRIQEIDMQLAALDRAQEYITTRNKSEETLPTLIDLGNPAVSGQLTQLITAEEELNRLKQISGPENPKVLALERQISRLRPAIQEGATNYRNNLLATKSAYQRQQGMYSSKLRATPQKEKSFIDITRQQSIKNDIYSYLLEKREENIISMAGLVGNSQFISRPSGMGLISPKPLLMYTFFILGAIGSFAAFLALKELTNNTYQSRTEVENSIQAPILGELMEFTQKKGEEKQVFMVNPLKPNIIGEQIREIRTNLMYMGIGGDNKTILITSSMPGEGKTTVSINIAASLSSTGKKVALLAFDLRKGKLGELCKVPTNPGVSNYLVGQASLAKICHRLDGFSNLDVYPEGLRPPNPAELILNERMEKLMQELKFHYDYIVIDSPPIGSVTDARLIAMYAYATIYVVRHQYTPRTYFPMIRELYAKKRLPNMSLLLNGIKKYSFMGYSYGNGHSSGYGYGYGYGYLDSEKPAAGKKRKGEEAKVG